MSTTKPTESGVQFNADLPDGPVTVTVRESNPEQVLVTVDGPGIYHAIAIDRPPQLAALKTTLPADVAQRVNEAVRDQLADASKYGRPQGGQR